jgi:8-oxo-dGTP diphosphatase
VHAGRALSTLASVIEAAGGLVWRTTPASSIEILVIHRPARDDWSLPKGKREGRETAVRCALREVHEETGLRCDVGPELPTARYRDRKGRAKQVRYWAMQRRSGSFRRNREVDEVRWVPIDQVDGLLAGHELAAIAGFMELRSSVA